MMKIQWLGHACFLITTSGGKKIMTDPFDSSVGLAEPAVPADIVTVSHQHFDHNAVGVVPGNPVVVQEAGERKIDTITFTGIPSYHDQAGGRQRGNNTIFLIEADGLKICHLGDLGHVLEEEQKSRLSGVDVLMVPVGGTYTIDAAEAARVVEQISPRYVIPMHFKTEALQLPIAPVEPFLKHFPAHTRSKELVVTADSLPAEQQVVVLEITPIASIG